MSAALLDPVIAATRETLSLMLRLEDVTIVPARSTGVAPVHEVSAVIGLSGDDVNGAVVLSADRATATALVSRFAGEPIGAFCDDVADGMAELANIVAGAAKRGLRPGLRLSLPTVVAGAGHQVFRARGVTNELAFLDTALGPVCVQVHLREGA